jgi:hypothetical protein
MVLSATWEAHARGAVAPLNAILGVATDVGVGEVHSTDEAG